MGGRVSPVKAKNRRSTVPPSRVTPPRAGVGPMSSPPSSSPEELEPDELEDEGVPLEPPLLAVEVDATALEAELECEEPLEAELGCAPPLEVLVEANVVLTRHLWPRSVRRPRRADGTIDRDRGDRAGPAAPTGSADGARPEPVPAERTA